MHGRRIHSFAVILLVTAVGPAWAASDSASTPAVSDSQRVSKIIENLKSKDPSHITEATKALRTMLMHGEGGEDIFKAMDALLADHEYQEADSICADAVLVDAYNTIWTANLQRDRIRALLGLGKKDEALAAAKSYYNVAPLSRTNDALSMVELCLRKAKPKDKEIARRFRQQQSAWAKVDYVPPANPTAPVTSPLGEPILETIEVDSTPYEESLEGIVLGDYTSYVTKGNLLLLADRADEAQQVFEAGFDLVNVPGATPDQVTSAVEDIARAIRAKNGCMGPANAYILSLRTKANPKK